MTTTRGESPERARPRARRPKRVRRRLIGVALVLGLGAVATASCAPLGARATGPRLERMKKSPEWQGSHFENAQPIVNDTWAAIGHLLSTDPHVTPESPPSTVPVDPGRFAN